MTARVGVVVVNHDAGDLTLDCLASLFATDWPDDRLRVVLVDNASRDDSVARARTAFPAVTIVESAVNAGFAGGCNMGIEVFGSDVDHVALVNNDATVDPGWLAPLVDALATDAELGAACPKILFTGGFAEVTLTAPTHRRGRGDRRELGVLVAGARIASNDVWARTQLVRGFWGRAPEVDGSWTTGGALLRLPVDGPGPYDAELRVAAESPTRVTIAGGSATATVDVGSDAAWHTFHIDGPVLDIVNNVGTELADDGYGADRGYQQPDDGRFDDPADVFAWCGAAVLLRRAYLDDVGLFDKRLFLYSEDLELSWRGRARGWRYRYVPESVVRHVHTATSREGSALKDHYHERNHLLVVTRHSPARAALRAVGRFLLVTGSYARRDVVSRLLHGERPAWSIVGRRVRAFGAFVARVPRMLLARRRDRHRARDHPDGARINP